MKTKVKKVWRTPELRELKAGSAEAGFSGGNDGQGQGQGRPGS